MQSPENLEKIPGANCEKSEGVLKDSLGRKRYPHRYKAGKQCEQLTFTEIREKVDAAKPRMDLESLAYFWLLYQSGVRKSELYERTVEDCSVTETHFIIDFRQRKKGSAEVPALEFPLWFPGMKVVCEQLEKARSRRSSRKLIERTVKGIRSRERVKASWLFPNIHRTRAAEIVKEILGDQYYPHFLRLNRITELCSDPEVNISRLKSYTGIKTLRVLQGYIGTSKKEQKKAVDFMGKQFKEKQQKDPDEL